MRKGLKKSAAFLLVVCMVFSLFSGVPVSVKANVTELSGLVAASWIDWPENGGIPTVHQPDANQNVADVYGKEVCADLSGATVGFGYLNEKSELTVLTAEQLSITFAGQSVEVATANEQNPELTDLSFDKTGDYIVTYNGKEDDAVTIHVEYPALGFYSTNTKSDNSFIKGEEFEYESGKGTEFYVIPNLNADDGWTDFQYTIKQEWGDASGVTVNGTALGEAGVTCNSTSDPAKIVIPENVSGDWALRVTSSYKYMDEENTEQIENNGPGCYIVCKEKKTGLVFVWGTEQGKKDEYCKSDRTTAKRTDGLYCATMDENGNTVPYTGDLTVKKVDNGVESDINDASVEKYEEEGVPKEGAYQVYFASAGTYRIYNEDASSFITMEVTDDFEAGFFSSNNIGSESYIDKQSMEYSSNSNRTFYFAYKQNPGEDMTCSVVTGDDGMPVLYDGDGEVEGITVTAAGTSGVYTVYKLTLEDSYGEFGGSICIRRNVQTQDGRKWTDECWLELSYKMEGLVHACPEWTADGPNVPENPDFSKYFDSFAMLTHVMYFATIGSDGNATGCTDTLTIKKVNADGSVTATSDGTIEKHVEYKWNEETETEVPYTVDYLYDLKFNRAASGIYRIYKGSSFVTVTITEADAGFFSSSDIGVNSYLDEQEMTFSESNNRTFYFAYKEKPGDDVTLEIAMDGNVPVLETNGNADQVSFKKISNSGEYTVYQITLGEKFEIGYCDKYNFGLQIQYSDGHKDVYELILHSQREGFVYTWPQWDDEIEDANYYITPIYGFEKVGSHTDEKTILYFGKMDADGNVTPVRNVGDITAGDGASIEKYEDGIPGFYIVTLPEREKEYTFTCGESKVRIRRDTPLIQFYTDQACSKEISDYTFFAGDNKDFYVKVRDISDMEWDNGYDYIVGKDEDSKYNEDDPSGEDYYFRINYVNDSSGLKVKDNDRFGIEQINTGSDSSKSEKIYKITVKDKAPAQCSLCIVTRINWDWTEDETIQICKMKTEADPTSTFKVDDKCVTIEETPQPNDLVGEDGEGLTEEQKFAVEAGADLSVSIKADAIKVDTEGKVEVPENASDEVKQELAKVQDAVDKIETTKDDKLSDKYETTFIDLTVNTVVEPTNGEKIMNPVKETKSPLIIKIPLPEGLKNKGHYVVIRFHDGKSDILTATYDSREGYLTFETDRFSTYAIAYRESEPIDSENFDSVTWENIGVDTFTYDRTTKTCKAKLAGLPNGYTAILSGTSASAVGEYMVKVDSITYTPEAGEPITYKVSELTGKLPKAVLDGYSWAIVKEDAGGSSGSSGGGSGSGGAGGGGGVPTQPTEPTDPTDPTEPATPEDTVQKGDIETVDGNSYQVTSVSATKKTVAYAGGDKTAKKIKIPSSVVIDGTTYKVTAIANHALSGYSKLTMVTIPSTVTKIGKNAFKNCTSLKSVTIPKNVTSIGTNAFYNCKKLTTVKFSGTKITKIGDGSFQKCAALKSVTIPISVKEIGKNAFKDCTKLSKIIFKGTKIKKIGKNAFANIAKKPVIAVPKNKKSAYKKLLDKAGYKKTVK